MSPRLIYALSSLILLPVLSAQEPPLPLGLDSTDSKAPSEPSLPPGLSNFETPPPQSTTTDPIESKGSVSKFRTRFDASVEARYGALLQSNGVSNDDSLSELRLQTQWGGSSSDLQYRVTVDWVADFLADSTAIDMRSGQGWIDPREAWLSAKPLPFLDLKAGRQISTWGTGDLLFISDLFPKDWQAFLLGRDETYLKAPSDAMKASFYFDAINLDVVYTPEFDPDRFVTGERIAYFDSQSGALSGRDRPIEANYPGGDELAIRAHRLIQNAEAAVYFNEGYWKQPVGWDPTSNQAIFPELRTYSASWRQPFAGGIISLEAGRYVSLNDRDGDDPNIRNSESRFLAGFERELVKNFTGSFQYYLERISDYNGLLEGLAADSPIPDRSRHLLTARFSQQLLMQDLQLSLFVFYSPSDDDGYLRPHLSYSIDDHWRIDFGANVFFGERPHTFFGQFEESSNVYMAIKRTFN